MYFEVHVYIDVSQNPIIGKNQSRDKLWMRIETQYHADEPFKNQPRPRRSLESRMGIILKAVSKLRGCVNQIVNKNPSGASEQDIVSIFKYLIVYCIYIQFRHIYNIFCRLIKRKCYLHKIQTTRKGLYLNMCGTSLKMFRNFRKSIQYLNLNKKLMHFLLL